MVFIFLKYRYFSPECEYVCQLCAAVAQFPPSLFPKVHTRPRKWCTHTVLKPRTEKEKDWPCFAARSERRLSAAESSLRPAAAVKAKWSSSSKRSGHPCRHGIFHGRSSRSAAAAVERFLSWHRSATASILRRSFCVMSWPSSPPDCPRQRETCSERELRARSRSFFFKPKKKRRGKVARGGAVGRCVLVV